MDGGPVKITNVGTRRLYLRDLRITHASQVEGRAGEDRYLAPGQFVYLPNTSEVLRSAFKGDLHAWKNQGIVTLEDQDTLDAYGGAGDTLTLSHGFGLPPQVLVLKQVGSTWVDATGTVDISHNNTFTTTTVRNTLTSSQTLFVRLV